MIEAKLPPARDVEEKAAAAMDEVEAAATTTDDACFVDKSGKRELGVLEIRLSLSPFVEQRTRSGRLKGEKWNLTSLRTQTREGKK